MTETPHTPWFIVEYGDGDSLAIHSDDENRVCFMATHGGSRAAWERIQANAELIVRAVNAHRDLVEALKDIAGMYDSWDPDASFPSTVLSKASERARAALTKAEVTHG